MVEIPNTVFGLTGLIITTLAGVIIWQQRRIDKRDTQISELYKVINSIQETRIADSKETRDKLAEPLREIAQYTELTYDKIIGGK